MVPVTWTVASCTGLDGRDASVYWTWGPSSCFRGGTMSREDTLATTAVAAAAGEGPSDLASSLRKADRWESWDSCCWCCSEESAASAGEDDASRWPSSRGWGTVWSCWSSLRVCRAPTRTGEADFEGARLRWRPGSCWRGCHSPAWEWQSWAPLSWTRCCCWCCCSLRGPLWCCCRWCSRELWSLFWERERERERERGKTTKCD